MENNTIQQELRIDIHVKHLKLKMDAPTPIRIIWSRGKKQAKTQVKMLSPGVDSAVFDEKFQINTVLDIDKDTLEPKKGKISKMTVCLDKSIQGGMKIAEQEFDMAEFTYKEYKTMRLYLIQSEGNEDYPVNPEESYIDIGLRGTNEDGLVQKRMSAIKNELGKSLKSSMMKSPTRSRKDVRFSRSPLAKAEEMVKQAELENKNNVVMQAMEKELTDRV